MVTYQVRRMPLAIGASFVAGNLSSLLGIGGGVVKVPVLNAWCGVPMRAAAATSALMIGVTATGGAIIYFGHGDLDLLLAAPAILGVQLGSRLGMRFTERASARWLKLLMAEDMPPETLRSNDKQLSIPPLYGALLKNEQDVHLFERLAFLARRG